MMKRWYWLPVLFIGITSCVVNYVLVTPGSTTVEDLTIQAGLGWNRVPPQHTLYARPGSETWTHDGVLLDRLVIIPAVPDGEPLLVSRSKTAALPVFNADMLPNEIEELVESSIVKFYGEGQSIVSTENLRPHRFGANRGVLFELSATVTDSPEYRGTVGAFISEDKLYIMYFMGAIPHYFDKHIEAAKELIQSAVLL
jgi:hypothetical protein